MNVCDIDHGSLLDFSGTCNRALFITLPPTALVLGLVISHIRFPGPFRRLLTIVESLFKPFLTLSEAEALNLQVLGNEGDAAANHGNQEVLELQKKIVLWRVTLFVVLGVVESLFRVAIAAYCIYKTPSRMWDSFVYLCSAIPWTYTVVRPIARPIKTVPYDLFLVYTVLFFCGALNVGGIIYDQVVFNIAAPTIILATVIIDMIILVVLLSSVITMPMGYWSSDVNSKDIVRVNRCLVTIITQLLIVGVLRISGRLLHFVRLGHIPMD